jgi:type II secretory pathway pseudopilin PulG
MIFFKRFFSFNSNAGQLMVEILVTMGLFAALSPALLTGFTTVSNSQIKQQKYTDSTSILKETQDAVRSVREKGWNSFATNGTFHPVLSNGIWSLASGSDVVGDFTRAIEISDVYRDNNGQIADSGTLDPSTKRVVITLSWNVPKESSISSTEYLTRYLDNLSYEETSEAQFSLGTLETVAVTNNNGGEVVLGAGGNADWCKPSDFIQAELDLPQNGAVRDVKAVEGKAFTGTNSGSGGSFVEVGISNDSPPVLTNLSTITGYETNDVFIDGNYAYVATGDISKDVVIIDLNTDTEVGYFNDSYPLGSAKGVWVVGNVGYVSIGPNIHTFDLSSKTGSRPELDHVCVGNGGFFPCVFSTANRLQVVGNYAYIAVDWGYAEMRIVDVTNPRNLVARGYADVNGAAGQEVYVNDTGTRAYLATSQDSSRREMFIINTSTKTGSLSVVGSYDSSGMNPKGITVVPGNRAILVGTGGEEYQVIDTTNESNPKRCGGMDVNNGIYGVSSVLESDGEAYSYVVTGDNTNEFKAILGGPGGTGSNYYPTGTFESSTFDAGITTAFNRIDSTLEIPSQTNLTYQVAVANAVNGSCSGAIFSFVGPDGTANTSYGTSGGPIPFGSTGDYSNPGRCFRYRATLSTEDSAFTPILDDIQINYSP